MKKGDPFFNVKPSGMAKVADFLLGKTKKGSMEETFLEVTKEALFHPRPGTQREAKRKIANHLLNPK